MLQLVIFTIFLATSPTFSLVGSLFQAENDCYSGCHSNYVNNLWNLNACKSGCDFKLHDEQCADQCKLLSIDEQIQASCLVGCSMNHPDIEPFQHSRSNILIRLRQRPLFHLPSSNSDSIETSNDVIKQSTNLIGQSNELKSVKNLSLRKSSKTSSFNEENTNQIKFFIFHREEKLNQLQQFIKNIRSEWNELICKPSKLSIWIILSIFILSSIILGYMTVSLCCRTPKHHNLSIRADEFIIEKEISQPDTPVKIKLTNI